MPGLISRSLCHAAHRTAPRHKRAKWHRRWPRGPGRIRRQRRGPTPGGSALWQQWRVGPRAAAQYDAGGAADGTTQRHAAYAANRASAAGGRASCIDRPVGDGRSGVENQSQQTPLRQSAVMRQTGIGVCIHLT